MATFTLISPSESKGVARAGAITFEFTDADLAYYAVFAAYDDGYAELVYDSESGAFYPFSATSTPITDGYRLAVTRRGGWRTSPTVRVVTADSTGVSSEGSWRLELLNA